MIARRSVLVLVVLALLAGSAAALRQRALERNRAEFRARYG